MGVDGCFGGFVWCQSQCEEQGESISVLEMFNYLWHDPALSSIYIDEIFKL